ncbi:MAG: hypothetical protein ACW977_07705, partial [Candidatus Thorarchaeota archaeon]
MVVSRLGIDVIDAHSHFMTYNTAKMIIERAGDLETIRKRVSSLTDMTSFDIPDEAWDSGKLWIDELDKYGIS